MKKIILSLSIIAAAAAIAVGATTAYFSDTETSTGNTFTAGTLNLKVSDADPLVDTFAITDVKPGDSNSPAKDWLLKNDGSIAGSLDVTFSNLLDQDNSCVEPEIGDEPGCVAQGLGAGTGELDSNLTITAYIDEDNNNAYGGGDTLIYNGLASGIVGEKLSNYAMAANYGSGNDKAVRIEWSVAGGVNNEIQSDSAGFDIGFELLQVAD